MRLLLRQQLPQRQRKILIQAHPHSLLGNILALLRGIEQRVVAAAQLRLQIAPHAMDCARRRAGLFDIMYARAMQLILQLGAEVRAFQRLRQKVALQRLVFQVFANIGKALLTVLQDVDNRLQNAVPSRSVCLNLWT